MGELSAVYVHPRTWDAGAGKELMLGAQRELRGMGYRQAVLWVLETNERARNFYAKGGWSPDGAVKTERRGDVGLHEVRYRTAL